MAETPLDQIRDMLAGQGREAVLRVDGLRSELMARFDAVDDRLYAIDEKQRIANGRATTMEKALVLLDERVGQLSRADGDHELEIAEIHKQMNTHRRKTDNTSVSRVHSRSTDGRWLTRRELKIVMSTLGIAGLVLKFIVELAPQVKALFR